MCKNGGQAFLLILISYIQASCTLKGNHMKLGEQCSASVETDAIHKVPQPSEFYEMFVKQDKPVVFRDAMKDSIAYNHWTEDYLINNYGNLTVRLESRSEQNVHLPEGALGLGLDLIGNFIRNYQNADAYVISQIPMPMEKDVLIPPCLRCGSFMNAIQEVHLFLSASGGKTALHKDPYNNIHCIFNGTKDWILIHPNQTDSLYMSKDSEYEWGGISDINVDDIDLHIYPKIAELKYSKLRLYKGDCIYMPSGYWHQVRSFGHMNSAIAIWFSTLDSFERTGCDGKHFDFVPMNTVPILWRYSGFGNLTQGHMDIYVLKRALLLWADEGTGQIDLTSFVNYFFVLRDINSNNEAMILDIERRKKLFVDYFGSESNAYTTSEFIHSLTIENLKDLVEIIHPNDLSNTDILEYGHLPVGNIVKIIMESLYEDGTFDTAGFLEHYIKVLGGTRTKGLEVIRALDIPESGLVSKQHILDRLDLALAKYSTALIHDSATEKQLFKFLKLGKRSFVHDEL